VNEPSSPERRWASFEEFYRAKFRWAGRRGVLALGDVALAEEVAQDVFLQAARSWDKIDNPDAWLLTVLSRRIAREGTKQRRIWQALGRLAGSARASIIDPEAQVDIREDYRRVRKAMDTLPGQQRVVIILRLVDELSEAETAAALGISASTVHEHLKRAIGKLHRQFGPHGERLITQLAEEGGTA
jgi:RNA polymerase sigma-70 factor (ECF subfamily)